MTADSCKIECDTQGPVSTSWCSVAPTTVWEALHVFIKALVLVLMIYNCCQCVLSLVNMINRFP